MPTARVPFRRLRHALATLAVAALLAPALVHAQDFVPDQGVYRVYQNDRVLGDERVTFEQRGDSLVVVSVVQQQLPHPDGKVDTLAKNSALVLSIRDGSLRGYQSYDVLNGDVLNRVLSMSDMTYTSYRQSAAGGFGDTYARPPGRIYVVDPQVFALFDVLCRDMHAQRFDERTVTLLYITARDTAVDARVKRLGTGPFKVGKETVIAEKFSITDPWSTFLAWVAPDGRMLRLMLPAVGLRVDREPESLKPHAIESLPPLPVDTPAVIMAPHGFRKTPAPAPVSPDSLPPRGR